MPKREISRPRLGGKRNSSQLQTYPKKTPQTPKADWHFTKPTGPTTKRSNLFRPETLEIVVLGSSGAGMEGEIALEVQDSNTKSSGASGELAHIADICN